MGEQILLFPVHIPLQRQKRKERQIQGDAQATPFPPTSPSSRYLPALAPMVLLLAYLQPLLEQEALASGRGAGCGAVGPGCFLVAGRGDLDGGQLEVLLGAGAAPAQLSVPQLLLLAQHVLHPAHLETLPSQRGGGGAGPGYCPRHSGTVIAGAVARDLHVKGRKPEGLAHCFCQGWIEFKVQRAGLRFDKERNKRKKSLWLLFKKLISVKVVLGSN